MGSHVVAAGATALRLPLALCARHRATLLLVCGGLILPNALALVAGAVIGLPIRPGAIAGYALIALLCGRVWRPLLAAAFLALLAYDGLNVVCRIFLLDLPMLVRTLPAALHVEFLRSPAYALLALGVVTFAAANVLFLTLAAPAMRRGSRSVYGLAVAAMLAWDGVANGSASYDLGPAAAIGKPFESAVERSGFAALPTAPRPPRHAMLVLVESLGVLKDPGQRALLLAPFGDPELRRHYAVTTGTTTFFGATAYGEMRELCHSRASYVSILDGEDPFCLPDAFAARGYRTVSVHGFHGEFYDRENWYPKAGFVRSVFQESFTRPFKRHCGGPFAGPCDVDVADAISERIAASTQPYFLYWLTLNSHVPVHRGQATPRHDCGNGGGPFGDAEVCAMAEIWEDLFVAVRRLALANPGTEILLVGDHAPPLWRRAARGLFAPDRVPWIRLSPRQAVAGGP